MSTATVTAVWEGHVFVPKGVVPLENGAEVVITFEAPKSITNASSSFLKVARRIAKEKKLDLPADASTNFDEYLHEETRPRG